MSNEQLIIFLIVAFVVYRFATRKERKARKLRKRQERQWAEENALPDVSTNMRVIIESVELFRKTKNQDTARSRYNLALERLEYLLQQFPHRTDWRELLEALQQEGKFVLQNNLAATLAKYEEKADIAKTVGTKITNYNRALMELSDAKSSGEYDNDWLDTQKERIEAMIHSTEYGKLLEIAERHEFKEDWKKALSAYQDVLFFLKKDNVDDAEQADIFDKVNDKIAGIKGNME